MKAQSTGIRVLMAYNQTPSRQRGRVHAFARRLRQSGIDVFMAPVPLKDPAAVERIIPQVHFVLVDCLEPDLLRNKNGKKRATADEALGQAEAASFFLERTASWGAKVIPITFCDIPPATSDLLRSPDYYKVGTDSDNRRLLQFMTDFYQNQSFTMGSVNRGFNKGGDVTTGNKGANGSKSREITVTGHALTGERAFQFKKGEIYRLRFRVGPPIPESLVSGNATVENIPKGGLNTCWVVTSTNVEFISAKSLSKTSKIGKTWLSKFHLRIPEQGISQTKEIAVVSKADCGNLLVTIFAISKDGRLELYRELTVELTNRISLENDAVCKAPQFTHLNNTHEWTTPPEHIQVSVMSGLVQVSTKRSRLEDYEFTEPFNVGSSQISGPINNVREALEAFRERHTEYLNDLNIEELVEKFTKVGAWRPVQSTNGWQPLPAGASPVHIKTFQEIQQTREWRDLAQTGYVLFDSCFPQGSKLRGLINKLLPGSRIDFHWTPQSGPAFVSHVPWFLMYLEPVDVTGRTLPDPEKFLGLRFRISSRSWNVNNGSVILGGLESVHLLHLMYWGNKAGDEVATEAQWQTSEYKKWRQAQLLPDNTSSNPREQLLAALDKPGPSPVGMLYFYCHCSVGDGARPSLRFGNGREDVLGQTDLSYSNIPDGPIVFANACSTAHADPHMTSELEHSFFSRGARAFIGTEAKVPVMLASKFAWLFFQFFYRMADVKPMAAGEALVQARMFLWTQFRNVGGLFYSITNQYELYLASEEEVLRMRS